ncbi:peptidylprolyl isomerase [Patescibacteria group bacterium]|nr:peptidylprolyl isomerase [Patescibacteria group bacterium]
MEQETIHEEGKMKKDKFLKLKGYLSKIKQKANKLGRKTIKLIERMDKRIFVIVVSVIVVAVCFLGMIGLGVYRFHWDNKYVNKIVDVFNFPAAIVNGDVVKYSDWREELKAVTMLNEKKQANMTDRQVEEEVINKLIQDSLLRGLARKFDVTVTEEDYAKSIEQLAPQFGGMDGLDQTLQDYFGWDMATFKLRLLYSQVLKEKLKAEIPENKKVQRDAEKRANEVLEILNKGEKTFEDAAKEFSDDFVSGKNGGDLGWFPRGVMVKEFETAAFNLKPGEMSGLVKTKYGYHIILVDDHQDADSSQNVDEKVKARHILLAFETIDDYLQELQDNSRIYKFVSLDKDK